MKTKLLKIFSLFTAMLMILTSFAACGEEASSEAESAETTAADGASSGSISMWNGYYTNDSGTLTMEVAADMEDAVSYSLLSTEYGSAASGYLTYNEDQPNVLEDEYYVFTYNEDNNTIEITPQEGATEFQNYTGVYEFQSIAEEATTEAPADVPAPDSIEAWYGEYTSDNGTLTISSSLEDMVDYSFSANDGSYMSGTWMKSSSGLGVMEDSYLTATYDVEDGTIEVEGKTEDDNESNASFIGVYTPNE